MLNGDTETFIADTENINDGYPVFKPNKIEQIIYDGYVKESAFESFKKNISTNGGSADVYNLDIDVSGLISSIDSSLQTIIFGKTYIAPTNDNIIELLGGNDGVRQLCEKLILSKTPIVTVPFLAYVYPTKLISSAIMFAIVSPDGNGYLSSIVDGCDIVIGIRFFVYSGGSAFATVDIIIENFNTSTQSATYTFEYGNIGQSSGGSTEVLDILTSTNSTAALSANQGRVLKGLIDNISSTTVVNSLTSTSTTNALSAAKGKELKTLVDGKVASTEITTIKKLTQSAYDTLSSKDSKTLYVIV